MKSFNKILMMVFSLAFLMFACKEDDVVSTEKEKEKPYLDYESATDFWFPKEAGFIEIPVTDVNGAYFATVAEGGEWCTTSEIGVNSFKISYAENKRAENRTTKITLSLDGVDDIDIVVSQRGPGVMLVIDSSKYSEVAIPYVGGDTVVSIVTNGDYKVDVEAGNEWCSVANKTETEFKFNISQNNELASRSAKVTVSLMYQDSTARFEFVVNQLPTPILLNLPESETEIVKASFPYSFSWGKTGAIPSYSIAVSTSIDFPEEATNVINVGDVDSYALKLSDITEVMTHSGKLRVPLYWKVMPTDPDIDIATETKVFYVPRQTFVASYPLTLNGGDSSWIGFDDSEDYPKWSANAGQSSRRTYISTYGLTEAIEETGAFVLAYDYKTSNRNSMYEWDDFYVYHYAGGYDGNWEIDGPGVRYPFTDVWLPVVFPLTETRAWGQVGSKITIFIRPIEVTSNNNNISGMFQHVKDLRVEVYE
jgi:hypothetical protein